MQTEMFPTDKPTPEQIIAKAAEHSPIATFAMFSGGDGSLAATHWAMNNVPGCQVAHVNTGIGIPATGEFVRETCRREGWPLTEIRAKEDCGQDYDKIVIKYGFPGPFQHGRMYAQLKERAIRLLIRREKAKLPEKQRRRGKVMLLTGICKDDSVRRSGYGNQIIAFNGAQMWVNHIYHWGKTKRYHYICEHNIPRNPVSELLGMSGECCCAAYAHYGELAAVRLVCPKTANRIEKLEKQVRAAGHDWGWEDKPPRKRDDQITQDMFMPMCVGCLKEEERRAA